MQRTQDVKARALDNLRSSNAEVLVSTCRDVQKPRWDVNAQSSDSINDVKVGQISYQSELLQNCADRTK